jgi:tellurite resistance-related uncharacterized protein
MSSVIPEGLHSYERTPSFTEETVPRGLLGEHATKEGVWGQIHVEEGQLHYVVTDPRRETSRRVLTPRTAPGIVEPTIVHRVEPVGPVRFHVEFFRAAGGADPRLLSG